MISVSFVPVYSLLSVIWLLAAIPRIKAKRTTTLQEIGLWLLFAYLLAVVELTFTPFLLTLVYFTRNATLIPFVETLELIRYARPSVSVYNILGNFLLLAPFGFLWPAVYPRVRKSRAIILYSFVLSLFVETLQWVYAVRIFDIDDVIFNTIGGWFGYIAFLIVWKMTSKKKDDKNNAWAQKSPLKLFLAGLSVFTLITTSVFAVAYFAQTLSENKIHNLIEESGAEVVLTYDSDEYRYLLVKEKEGTLRLDLYSVFPMSRYIKTTWSTTPVNQRADSETIILEDLIFEASYPALTGMGREMIVKRAPYAVFSKMPESITEVYAEYNGEKFPAIAVEGYFLIIIDRQIPLADLRAKVSVKAVTADGEILPLKF